MRRSRRQSLHIISRPPKSTGHPHCSTSSLTIQSLQVGRWFLHLSGGDGTNRRRGPAQIPKLTKRMWNGSCDDSKRNEIRSAAERRCTFLFEVFAFGFIRPLESMLDLVRPFPDHRHGSMSLSVALDWAYNSSIPLLSTPFQLPLRSSIWLSTCRN